MAKQSEMLENGLEKVHNKIDFSEIWITRSLKQEETLGRGCQDLLRSREHLWYILSVISGPLCDRIVL